MAKWDYLIEAEDDLRKAWRMHSEDPRAFLRAIARIRGSKELVDKADELAALNARAARITQWYEATEFVRDAFKRGFAVIMRHRSYGSMVRRPLVDIFSPSPDTAWITRTTRDEWPTVRTVGWGGQINGRIIGAYDILDYVVSHGIEVAPEDPNADYIEYRPATPDEIQMATPRFAAIPLSALPSSIRRQMGLERNG